jgi:hypothetical protein
MCSSSLRISLVHVQIQFVRVCPTVSAWHVFRCFVFWLRTQCSWKLKKNWNCHWVSENRKMWNGKIIWKDEMGDYVQKSKKNVQKSKKVKWKNSSEGRNGWLHPKIEEFAKGCRLFCEKNAFLKPSLFLVPFNRKKWNEKRIRRNDETGHYVRSKIEEFAKVCVVNLVHETKSATVVVRIKRIPVIWLLLCECICQSYTYVRLHVQTQFEGRLVCR